MKRIASLTMAFAMLAFLMLGAGACSCGVSYYGTYADADKYSTGNFNYEAGMVTSVEINWVDGSIELIQSDASTLSVSESGGTLDAEEQMHYYINL